MKKSKTLLIYSSVLSRQHIVLIPKGYEPVYGGRIQIGDMFLEGGKHNALLMGRFKFVTHSKQLQDIEGTDPEINNKMLVVRKEKQNRESYK